MRSGQVAKKLGVSKGTVINWGHWYEEYLSAPPAPGEDRAFTDDDVRVLAYVKGLSEKGLTRVGVQEALLQKRDTGTAFPPLLPDALGMADQAETALALVETKEKLALKEAEVSELSGTIQELRRQIEFITSLADKDKIEAQRRYDALVEKYSLELARLNFEMGKMQEQLKNAQGGR
jgi:DNA-binding transcriptional MerR regulator